MRIYKMMDADGQKSIGTLLYYEKAKDYIIELEEDLDEWEAPLLLASFVKKGEFTIPRNVSFMWVNERIIPKERQNISAILAAQRMSSYDEMRLLELSRGRCSQDSLYIERIDNIPDYVTDRQRRNLKECFVTDKRHCICFFKDHTARKIDISQLSGVEGIDKIVSNDSLFYSGRPGTGGYYMTFDNSYDISAEFLYKSGAEIPVSLEDFTNFVKMNMQDTSQVYEELGCSRQNIAYMVKHGKLTPLREDVKGSLFLRGDVLSGTWG